MREITKRSKVLGFSKLEDTLIKVLTEKPQTIACLADKINAPRTSLYRPLKALSIRGFIEKVTLNKRVRWRLVSQESLVASLSPILFIGIEAPLHPEFFLHTGKETLMQLYEKLAERPGVRVYAIQPNRSAESVLNIFPFSRLVRLTERIKENKVIVEALLQEDFIPFYTDLIRRRGLSIKKILTAFGGRSADTSYVPKNFLDFDSEITILPNVAYLFHWSKLIAIEVRNKETLGLLLDLFALAKSIGHKVDQNELVRKYLKKEEK